MSGACSGLRCDSCFYMIPDKLRRPLIFYYAHLNRYAAGLTPGTEVVQGQTIGYVGQTGNAPVPHLHFEIQAQTAGRKWWRGIAMNPYPVLKAGTLETLQASAESVRLRPARAAQY